MRFRLSIFRLIAVFGLAASTASLADQVLDDGTFCSFDSGCSEVTSSAYGKPLGIPLPVFGLLHFAIALGLTLLGRENALRAARWLAFLGAAVGIGLVIVQFAVIGRACPLCLVADGCALAAGLLAIVPFAASSPSTVVRAIWFVLAAVSILVPLIVTLADDHPETPDWVQSHWVEGKIAVVEVTDFECEHCRKADQFVRERLKDRNDVDFVRIPVALPHHANSRPAAIAYMAAKAQGRGEEMAVALFAATSLTPTDCRRIASGLGLRMDDYDRIVEDPATDAEVSTRSSAARTALAIVPQIWIQSHVIYGSSATESLDSTLRRTRPYRVK